MPAASWDPDDPDTWQRDEKYYPYRVSHLTGDYAAAIAAGIDARSRQFGVPLLIRCKTSDGWVLQGRSVLPGQDRNDVAREEARCRRELRDICTRYWNETALPSLKRWYEAIDHADVPGSSSSELAALWVATWNVVRRAHEMHFLVIGGANQAALELFEALSPRIGERDAAAVVAALKADGPTIARFRTDFSGLAEHALANGALATACAGRVDPNHLAADLSKFPEFLACFDEFVRMHGHLGQAFEDLVLPCWRELPVRLLEEVCRAVRGEPREVTQIGATLRLNLHAVTADPEFSALAEACRLAEEHSYWLDRMLLSTVRGFVLRVEERLVTEGRLKRGDIFFLRADEVPEVIEGSDGWPGVIERRRAVVASHLDERAATKRGVGTRRILKGIGISEGRVSGRLAVINDPLDLDNVGQGDVLVCRNTNPSWVPVMSTASAIITEDGPLSHAAVVARSLGVPGVANARGAMELPSGWVAVVDASEGTVEAWEGE